MSPKYLLPALPILVVAVAVAVAGCSSDSDGGNSTPNGGNAANGNSADSSSGPASNCADRCAIKMTECGAESREQADAVCSPLCSGMTETRLRCIETTSCERIVDVLSDPSLCGGGGGGGSSNSGGSTSGDGGTTNSAGSCTVGAAPTCDGDKVVTCKDVAGQPVRESETCSGDCRNGRCRPPHEACRPYSVGVADSCDDKPCTVKVTSGNSSYCTTLCGPNGVCPLGTRCEGTVSQVCKR